MFQFDVINPKVANTHKNCGYHTQISLSSTEQQYNFQLELTMEIIGDIWLKIL